MSIFFASTDRFVHGAAMADQRVRILVSEGERITDVVVSSAEWRSATAMLKACRISAVRDVGRALTKTSAAHPATAINPEPEKETMPITPKTPNLPQTPSQLPTITPQGPRPMPNYSEVYRPSSPPAKPFAPAPPGPGKGPGPGPGRP